MALSSKTMQVAMKTALTITKITGISILKTSSIALKAAWKLTKGFKK